MNVLVLGGTVFFGRHLVAALVARGHAVTTFNRGTHDVDRHLPVTRLHGDRTQARDLARIPEHGWDAVVDPSSDVPAHVEAAARRLRGAGRYVYVSSVSAYDLSRALIDERSRTFTAVSGDPDAATAEAYGWRKATSERRVAAVFDPMRTTVVRPGLIVGPYDPTDRFTYWPVRFARGGNVLVPGRPERPVQFIDVRDVADFVVRAIERDIAGTFNLTSPRGRVHMRDVVDAARDASPKLAAATWVESDFLAGRGLEGWVDLPLWLPPATPYPGIMDVDVTRALVAGLRFRPLAETVRALREWTDRTGRTALAAGLEPAREQELLHAWNDATSS